MILGFIEDYCRIIVNVNQLIHQLIFTGANTDTNAVVQESYRCCCCRASQSIAAQNRVDDTLHQNCGSKKNSTVQSNRQGHTHCHKFSYMRIVRLSTATCYIEAHLDCENLHATRETSIHSRRIPDCTVNKNASHFDHCNIRDI